MSTLRSVLLVAATAAAVLVPATAEAAGYSHYDAARDVVKIDEQGRSTPEPTRTSGDLTSVSIYNNPRRLIVVVGLTEISPQRDDLTGLVLAVRTSRKVRRDVALVNVTGVTNGYRPIITNRRGQTLRCDAATVVDRPSRSATVVIPRACLGRQRWVQVGAGFLAVKGESIYADDAQRNGGVSQSDLVFSPRVRRN